MILKFISSGLIVLVFFTSFSQSGNMSSGDPITEAKFPGGTSEMIKFIQENLQIPSNFKGEGRVFLRFTISENGEVKNIQLRRGIDECPDCSDAAMEVLKKMPKWKPAFSNIEKKEVASEFVLPIKFEQKTGGK